MENYSYYELASNRTVKHPDSQLDPDVLPEKGLEDAFAYFDEIEIRKGREERMVINRFNEFLAEEAARYGVAAPVFPMERVRILEEEDYDRIMRMDTKKSLGVYSQLAGTILLRGKSLKSLHILMHELLHYYSFQKIDQDNNGERIGVRLGYDGYDSHTFVGFNEGVTEIVAADILARHREEIERIIRSFRSGEAGENEKEAFFRPALGRFVRFVRMVVEKMAEKNGKKSEEVFEKFEEGMFSGRMMHLREIEKTFGPGSLRLLAYYDIYESSQTDKMIYEYFQGIGQEKDARTLVAELEHIRSSVQPAQAA